MVKISHEATIAPVNDRRGKGYELEYEDKQTGATVKAFVKAENQQDAKAKLKKALSDAADFGVN